MTKKNIDPAELSDSSEEFPLKQKRGCTHVNKGVALSNWRKQFVGPSASEPVQNQAETSKKPQTGCKECRTKSIESSEDGVWICLRCAVVACGSPQESSSHIHKHFTDPRSDPHVIAINLENWKAWCHTCNEEKEATSSRKLQEAAEFLKRHFTFTSPIINVPKVEVINNDTESKDAPPSVVVNNKPKEHLTAMSRVKGLTNLGNTCFFNSVLQCLAQTQFLSALLSESQEGEPFSLPGVPGDENRAELPPITGTLEPAGPVTKELATTLTEMQKDDNSCIVNPNTLLSALSLKAPHLAGTGDQEDAHELLRTLMETVRAEELRRYQAKILAAIGLSRKIDPSVVEEDKKHMAKEYSNCASKLYLRPDHMFQGQLMSILQCQDCRSVSCTYETFLDISLPVVSIRLPPNVTRKKSTDPDAPSKHQLKKARMLNKKKKGRALANNQAKQEEGKEETAEVKSEGEKIVQEKGSLEIEISAEKEVEDKEDAAMEEVMEGMKSLLDSDNSNADSSNELSETLSDAKGSPDEDQPASEDDCSTWSTTLAPRSSVVEVSSDLSVASCLKQFTAIELLTGNNKVGCETCTKRAGKSANGKLVSTNFTKQLLISAPPGILTLHLKRFEVCGSQFRKVSKAVDFPLILDLATFCSVKCKNLPTVNKEQSKILYSLYGVVEHRGMLSGGHYVAYIKSQEVPSKEDFRQRFFLSNNAKEEERPLTSYDEAVAEAPSSGKWYYASDSYVSEVPLKKVLTSQAYMLFYERIY